MEGDVCSFVEVVEAASSSSLGDADDVMCDGRSFGGDFG